ncbi:hypothetical protein C0Q70_01905 [Pomacea canaliculata]|uniref:Uncharacterized protein n=1 Tax=Pomacea canaliculata TaxID=400727 RepID=A0A2T7Q0V6_POMCA|nr:hypothetical protein C0Q70_01905 [Pomacea canaliculata]
MKAGDRPFRDSERKRHPNPKAQVKFAMRIQKENKEASSGHELGRSFDTLLLAVFKRQRRTHEFQL